ncbi:MAG TPA: dTMP kinase [Gemmatimonadaceae bacterium]|nr:dTMP kinase [Gemmatimonadaceae bacterium]
MPAGARGRLIVFEGPEGAGKSTQLGRLADWLAARGLAPRVVREPGTSAVGQEIRRVLLDPVHDVAPAAEALLFMAARAQLVAQELRPALEAGATVLADRFFLSTYAYQVAGRGLAEAEVLAANRLATGGLAPDLTLLVRVPPDVGLARALRRGGPDRMEQAGDAFHARVAAAFERFAEPAWQAAHPECGPIAAVDGTGDELTVFTRVVEALAAHWPELAAAGAGTAARG